MSNGIFLSHSGFQKAFVRKLYAALSKVGHLPFLDEETLLVGEMYPAALQKALEQCRLAVVVLSEEFMTSHWPMRELDLLYRRLHLQEHQNNNDGAITSVTSNKRLTIYPLFYGLSPSALRSADNLARWKCTWEKVQAKHGVDISLWEEAVKELPLRNGEELRPPTSEDSYIEKIVKRICKLVPVPLRYDESRLSGQERLIELMTARFDCAQVVCKSVFGACVIGLYGVGGLGKTTLCQLMANRFFHDFPGKSIWMEFPTDGNKSEILRLCKDLLKRCSHASEEHIIDQIDSLDKVFPELKKWVNEQDIFLAIDNVWESTLEEGKRLLEVGFSRDSKIMATSRSKHVLEELLRGCDLKGICIQPVPSLDGQEALSMLMRSFNGDLSFVPRTSLDKALEACIFEGVYHPVAVQTVGKMCKRLAQAQPVADQDVVTVTISRLSCDLASVKKDVESLIAINYNGIPPDRQQVFLDVVVLLSCAEDVDEAFCYVHPAWQTWSCLSYEHMQRALAILYECSKDDIDLLMHQLAADGLLNFEVTTQRQRRVVVHDLYRELAVRKAREDPCFLLPDDDVRRVQWKALRRAVVGNSMQMDELLCQNDLPQLQMLIAVSHSDWLPQSAGTQLKLKSMPALRMLIVHGDCEINLYTSKKMNACSRLAWLQLNGCKWATGLITTWLQQDAEINTQELEVLVLRDCTPSMTWSSKLVSRVGSRMETLDLALHCEYPSFHGHQLTNVKQLQLAEMGIRSGRSWGFDKSWELSLEDCCNLESLFVFDCNMKRINGTIFALLRRVFLLSCKELEVMSVRDEEKALQLEELEMSDLPQLHHLPDTCVNKRIRVSECGGELDFLKWSKMNALEDVHLHKVQTPSDFHGLHNLQAIMFRNVRALPNLHGLVSLRILEIAYCQNLTAFPDLSHLVHLQQIIIKCCDGITAIPELHALASLTQIVIDWCNNLVTMPSLHGLINLEDIFIRSCRKIMKLPNLHGLVNLKSIKIITCSNLRALPDLNGLACLQWIYISGSPIVSIPDLHEHHKLMLAIERCTDLKMISGKVITADGPWGAIRKGRLVKVKATDILSALP